MKYFDKGFGRSVVESVEKKFDTSDLEIAGLSKPETIFFIVGHPKSGTTWLSKILNSHPEIGCNYEGHFFSRDDGYNTLSNSLHDSLGLKQWADRKFNNWTASADAEIKCFVKIIVMYYFQLFTYKSGKTIIGDKSPTYQLTETAELFPNAKIIHIIRDGRDVAVSMAFHRSKETTRYMTPKMSNKLDKLIRKMSISMPLKGLPDGYVAHSAKIWKEEVARCMAEGQEKFNSNYLEIKYEELVASPVAGVKRILAFLGGEYDSGIIDACLEQASFRRLSGGREQGVQDKNSFFRKGIAGDWKNYFTEKNLRIYHDVAGDLLELLGYMRQE